MASTDQERDFQKDLQKIKPGKKDPLKEKKLSTILKMVFYDGFEQKEVTDLKIGDVSQAGNIVGQITPTPQKGSINLSKEVKSALLNYINALKQSGPTTSAASNPPLFPRYHGDSGRKQFRRELKSLNIDFNFLRRDGIYHYYQILRGNGCTHIQAIKETARHFRMGERSIEYLVKGGAWVKSERYREDMYRKDPIMGPFFRMEELGRYISNEAGEMIDGFFNAVNKEKEKYVGEHTGLKNILLDDMIKAIYGNEIPERLKKALNLPSTPSQSPAITPNQKLQSYREALKELIDEPAEETLKRQQLEAEERSRKWKEKKEKLFAIFEDPEVHHTPEEKVAYKKKKLLETIEKVDATLSEKEKADFIRTKKWLEESPYSRESRKEKQERQLKEIFREEKKKEEQDIIRVGVICPESANERSYVSEAVDLARDQINNAGGINGYRLDTIVKYDGSFDFGALSILKNFARKKVVAVIGPMRSAQIQTILKVKKSDVPMGIGGTNVTLTRQGNPWFFRCRPDDSLVAKAMVEYIKGDTGFKRVGILHDSDIFGTDGANLVHQECRNNGLTVVKKESYSTGNKDYRATLASLKDAGAEVMVVYGTSPEDVAMIQKQYRSLGSPYAYLGSPSSGIKACLNLSGKDAEDLIVIADYVPGRAATQKYANEYKQRFNKEMDPTAAWYYDALKILEMAIGQVGTNPVNIITAILDIRGYEGVLGTYDFTPDGDGLHKVSVVQIKNGGHQLIK